MRSDATSPGDAASQGKAQGGATSRGKSQRGATSRGKSQGGATSRGKAQVGGQGKSQGKSQGKAQGGGRAQRQGGGRAEAARAAAARAATSGGATSRGSATTVASSASSSGALVSAHELADRLNEERRRANRLRSRALAAGAGALPAVVVGVVVGVVAGVVAGVVSAAVVFAGLVCAVSAGSLALGLRMVGGAPVPQGALRALENQVEGVCATLGVAQPTLWLVDDSVANACVLAGRRGRSVLVVTSGLLSRMGLIQMEGVVAHELVHLRRRDAAVSSAAVATAGVVAWVTGRDALVHLAVGRGREYETDQAAALAVRYPPGLRDALVSMGGEPTTQASPFRGRRWAATRWIWIDPTPDAHERAPAGELDATKTRIDALAEC